MFKKYVLICFITGTLSGFVATAVQYTSVDPLIFEAEKYEKNNVNSVEKPIKIIELTGNYSVLSMWFHDDVPWTPEGRIERMLFSLLVNIVAGTGYALLICCGFILFGIRDWRHGLYWGMGGFFSLYLLPTTLYSPVVPGTFETHLIVRQIWWLATVLGAITGLLIAAKCKQTLLKILGLTCIAIPTMVGSPPGEVIVLAPSAIAEAFHAATIIHNFCFWSALGLITSYLHQKYIKASSNYNAKSYEEFFNLNKFSIKFVNQGIVISLIIVIFALFVIGQSLSLRYTDVLQKDTHIHKLSTTIDNVRHTLKLLENKVNDSSQTNQTLLKKEFVRANMEIKLYIDTWEEFYPEAESESQNDEALAAIKDTLYSLSSSLKLLIQSHTSQYQQQVSILLPKMRTVDSTFLIAKKSLNTRHLVLTEDNFNQSFILILIQYILLCVLPVTIALYCFFSEPIEQATQQLSVG